MDKKQQENNRIILTKEKRFPNERKGMAKMNNGTSTTAKQGQTTTKQYLKMQGNQFKREGRRMTMIRK